MIMMMTMMLLLQLPLLPSLHVTTDVAFTLIMTAMMMMMTMMMIVTTTTTDCHLKLHFIFVTIVDKYTQIYTRTLKPTVIPSYSLYGMS